MILWRRHASAAWLAENGSMLEEMASPHLTIISQPDRMRSLIEVACKRRTEANRLLRRFGGRIEALPRNWFKASPPHPPIRVGRRLEVVSEKVPAPDGRRQLVIPGAGAFGTGEHATTSLSLRLLEETTRKFAAGWRLLDAGTGTGILALAARILGAAEAVGIDNDPRAIAVARSNARLNRIGRVRFRVGDVLRLRISDSPGQGRKTAAPRYDIVTANLFSELLIALLAGFREELTPHGRIILSGILREQADEVTAALAESGFSLERKRRRGKWVALLASAKT
jgi:ribosomal protein L11 methyltransferase